MSKIILISCVSQKKETKSKAKDLYTSTLFKSSLDYAQKLNPDKIFILSALHHLLDLDEEIEPYNVTLSAVPKNKRKADLIILSAKQKIEWGKKVIEMLTKEVDLKSDEFIFLAGNGYIKPLERCSLIKNIKKPLDGLRVGERIKFMQSK
jgi:hypothetical protein